MTRILLLGSGELGREVAIEAARLGVEVVAADRYDDAPAMLVSPHRRVLDMTDPAALRALVEEVRPDLVVPEVEALATTELEALEAQGVHVVPTARAARLTMDRERIRRLAAEELGLPTSPYRFASSEAEFLAAVESIGRPCVVKPVMSSSGKGQSVVTPDGDVQVDGDYRESWQPHPMTDAALARATEIAVTVVDALGGHGLFGVELFVTAGGDVLFSEVSPRPHDTGMVTMLSQPTSEFALHVRAVLGLPVRADDVTVARPSASAVVLGTGSGTPSYSGLDDALAVPTAQLRIFGKPTSHPGRRLGVALAQGDTVEQARERARAAAAAVTVTTSVD
jgi:phosphoribosylglycinamide formyltransferase 2